MSDIVPVSTHLPAHIAARMNKGLSLGDSLGGGIEGQKALPRISIKGSTFRIVEGSSETVLEERKLNVIIVGANPNLSKQFYAKKWTGEPDDSGAPDCQSLDGIRPDSSVVNPQHDLCATCPQNAWGSKINEAGKQMKACADQKRLAVVAANAPGGTVYLLTVTPAALSNLRDYHNTLTRNGYPPECVVTQISFDTSASFPKLAFKFNKFVDEDTMGVIEELFDSSTVHEITGQRAQAAEVIHAEPKPLKVKAAPVIIDAEVEHVPAPKPAPKPVPKKASAFGGDDDDTPPAKSKPRVTKEPEPAKAVASASLADEISKMILEMPDDDAASDSD